MPCNRRGRRLPAAPGPVGGARRRRAACSAGGSRRWGAALATLAVAAVLAAAGCSSPNSSAPSAANSSAPSGSGSTPSGSSAPGIVAVTSSGALVVLNSSTGTTERTLVSSGVVGEELAVSPNGSTVYFTAGSGCSNEIESVPVSGGTPTSIASGVLPAISPDGTKLAFAQEPWFVPTSCAASASLSPSAYVLAVRTISGGSQTNFPMAASTPDAGLPIPILYLSWAPDNASVAVTMSGIQDNEGWLLNILSTASAQYYLSGAGDTEVPVTGSPDASRSYYGEAAYLPDGNLFVNRDCCQGDDPVNSAPADSNLMQEISTSGGLVHQVAIGIQDNEHTSLSVDPTGNWLLYISSSQTAASPNNVPSGTLYVSQAGAKPTALTTGMTAAAWL
jgi:hypothetical protein